MQVQTVVTRRRAAVAVAAAAGALVPGGTGAEAGGEILVTQEVITTGIDVPTFLTVAPGDFDRLFVTERAGRIRIIKSGALLEEPFLDISDQVNSEPPERAMACLAFHPDYPANGYFYVAYTDLNSDSVLARFQVTADPDVADPGSQSILITFPQPQPIHNVGWLSFGPDGYLYIGTGDGGLAGINAQDTSSLLGKLLRIDVDGPAPYGIPPDNPFVGTEGRDEIWAVGLRNPWRCAFDRDTDDLWIADVGEGQWEEISFQPAASPGGANYGWNCMEGDHCHAGDCTCNDPSLTDPVHEYSHSVGCAIIGGYVYRGSALPAMQGLYVYGDLCANKVWVYDPVLDSAEVLPGIYSGYSFGQDHDGELYVVSSSAIRKITIIDCNDNDVPDDQDISGGDSDDCDANGVPDECDPDCNGNMVADACDIANGDSRDRNGNGIPDECDEPADLDGDGMVGISDFLLLLANWGPCDEPCPPACLGDIDGDCTVGIVDFLLLLGAWG